MGAPYSWPADPPYREIAQRPPLFDGSPDGVAKQLVRVLHYLNSALRHNPTRRDAITDAYHKAHRGLVAVQFQAVQQEAQDGAQGVH